MGRSVAELFARENRQEYGENLWQAVALGGERYGLASSELSGLIKWIIEQARHL